MILLRSIQKKDISALTQFPQVPGMFNLPNDADLLKERVLKSISSFQGKNQKQENKFTFVAEDLDTKEICATSMIAGQHGTLDSPHFYFEVGTEKKFSETIGTGFIHGTLTLGMDTDGPSELGALVVNLSKRNSEARVGRQISFVRFLYAALFPHAFQPNLIAELLPPLNKKGLSPLWEAIGRRFTNMDYWEADQLSSKNKDFIFDLFPTGKIYTTFLSAEARNAIGKVSKATQPAQHMLKKIGFSYKNQVDPFDGGPHYWADLKELLPIKNTKSFYWTQKNLTTNDNTSSTLGLLTPTPKKQEENFQAVHAQVIVRQDSLTITPEGDRQTITSLLNLKEGDSISFMPYYS